MATKPEIGIVCPGKKRLLFFDFHPILGGTKNGGLRVEIEKVVLQYGWGRGSGRYIVRQFYWVKSSCS